MKRLFISLVFLATFACEPKKVKPEGTTSKPEPRRTSSIGTPSAVSQPSFLLKTSRISISGTGKSFSHSTIVDAAQADAILTDIRALPASAARDRAIAGVLGSLAKVDPEAARSRLAAWKDGLISEWIDAAKSVAEHLAKASPEAAARFIEEAVPPAARTVVWRRFLTGLPADQRLPFFNRVPESYLKTEMAVDLISVWLKEDPRACAAWFDGIAAGWSPEEVALLKAPISNVMSSKSGSGPLLAALESAGDEEVRHLFADVAWSRASPTERATLLPTLEKILPDLQDRDWEEIIRSNPAGYAGALSNPQIAELSSEDVEKLISSWSQTNPQAALDWAIAHQRPEAATALMPLYYQEPKRALDLASKLIPGKLRDESIGSLCQSLVHDGDESSAKTLLPLIDNSGFRELIHQSIEPDRK